MSEDTNIASAAPGGPRRGVRLPSGARRAAPLLLAAALLLIGFLRLAPGAAHLGDYNDFAFRELRYSDIISLYLRDHLERQPRPYLDYPLEYPALLGGLSYLLSFATTLPVYFALTYAVLALAALGTVAALGQLPGADAWYFAAAPTLVAHAGLNWDLAAIGCTAAALLAYARGRDWLGTLALVAAVWLKLFPLPFLVAVLLARLLQRRFRAAAEIGLLFAVGSAALNAPLALLNRESWLFFFTFNSERGVSSGPWLWLPQLTTPQVNQLTLAALALGGAIMACVAWRGRGAALFPLGAGLLLLWLLLNKVYSPQYALWIYLALALVRPPWALWTAFVAVDVGHYFVSFLVLFSLRFPDRTVLDWELHYLRLPLEALRAVLVAVCIGYALWRLAQGGAATSSPAPAPRAGREAAGL